MRRLEKNMKIAIKRVFFNFVKRNSLTKILWLFKHNEQNIAVYKNSFTCLTFKSMLVNNDQTTTFHVISKRDPIRLYGPSISYCTHILRDIMRSKTCTFS